MRRYIVRNKYTTNLNKKINMILTFPQFENLWLQHFARFLPESNPHNLYQSYLIRENCLEDF